MDVRGSGHAVYMRMSQTDKILLSLVRYAIGGGRDKIVFGDNLSRVIAQSVRQSVPLLVADGLQAFMAAYPEARILEKEPVADRVKRIHWLGQVMAHERIYAQHEKSMSDLARLYADRGIRMMVLKGYGLSLDWPVPNHRPVGDLDIYLFGKWQAADALVAKYFGVKVDDGHEHHTLFNLKGVVVENHYDFINTKAHRDAPKIEARLKDLAEKDCREIEVQGAKIYLPSADFNAIFLMRHMGQHFAGEHLNLRQILDWGFFVRAHHSEVDWIEAITFLKEIGLYTFFNQINAICIDYLGFGEDEFPFVERNEMLEERILCDVLHPEFAEEKPSSGLQNILAFKLHRWWRNRWKHVLIYNDKLWVTFVTLLLSHLKRIDTIKD